MKDEEYLFLSECREKKNIARSARNMRTHNGKGGRVRFPSDHKSKKELKAMSGEVKSYRLNEPMGWEEFKAMPDDIKVTYMKILQKKFNVPFQHIGTMLGVSQKVISRETVRLGLSHGRGGQKKAWDKEGWLAWCNGVPAAKEIPDEIPVEEAPVEEVVEELAPEEAPVTNWTPCEETAELLVPCSGDMTFVGSAAEALKVAGLLLGNTRVRICITWEAEN